MVQRFQRGRREVGHVSVQDHELIEGPPPLPGLHHRMARSELLALPEDLDMGPRGPKVGAHHLSSKAHHHRHLLIARLLRRPQRIRQHRFLQDRLHHFGKRTLHTSALARRQDQGSSFCSVPHGVTPFPPYSRIRGYVFPGTKTFLRKHPMQKGAPGQAPFPFFGEENGWGGWIRTSEWRIQSPLPCRLATPQYARSFELSRDFFRLSRFGKGHDRFKDKK